MISAYPYAKRWAAAALAAALLAGPATAARIQKLGFIDVERVYRESKQAQNIQKMLDSEFADRQRQLEKMQQEGLVLEKKIAAERPGKDRDMLVEKLNRHNSNVRIEQARLAEEYDLRRNEEFAALQHNADRVMIELAKKGGYDLIVHDVIYIDAKFDITDQVIREMNR